MNELRYFRSISPQAYEDARLALDAAVPMPQGETVYEPLATAPKASNGDVLIAIRTEHCQIQPYKSAVEAMLASGDATEITQAEYEAALPSAEAVADLNS